MKAIRRPIRRRQSEPKQRHEFNEAKYKILYFLFRSGRHFAPEEIAQQLKMTPASVRTRINKMLFQGYIWRKKEYREHRRNPYCYGFLKPMGVRVLIGTNSYTGMIRRMDMRRVIGEAITLNVKEEPTEAQKKKYELLLNYVR